MSAGEHRHRLWRLWSRRSVRVVTVGLVVAGAVAWWQSRPAGDGRTDRLARSVLLDVDYRRQHTTANGWAAELMHGPDSLPGQVVVYRAEDLEPRAPDHKNARLWFRVHVPSDEEIEEQRRRESGGGGWDIDLISRGAIDACYRIDLTRWGPRLHYDEPRWLKRVDCPDRVVPLPVTDPDADLEYLEPVYSGGTPEE